MQYILGIIGIIILVTLLSNIFLPLLVIIAIAVCISTVINKFRKKDNDQESQNFSSAKNVSNDDIIDVEYTEVVEEE